MCLLLYLHPELCLVWVAPSVYVYPVPGQNKMYPAANYLPSFLKSTATPFNTHLTLPSGNPLRCFLRVKSSDSRLQPLNLMSLLHGLSL